MVERRTFMKVGGLAALGFGADACAARQPARVAPTRPPLLLPPIRASWDRVIRTTVGLRPHRPSGFVLRADKLDAKLLVHNYGHGGAGMSLSWGTGAMAATLALQQPERRVAIVGCGAVGLTAARQFQRRGFDVTIYAMAIPPDTTSNMSLAGFTPVSGLIETGRRTAAWDAQFHEAGETSFRQLQLLVGRGYGVSWIDNFSLTDELRPRPTASAAGPAPLRLTSDDQQSVVYGPGEHPFPTKFASVRRTLRIEPSIYLDALMREVVLFGARIVIRKFDSPRDLMMLSEPVVVNCTGLGAKAIFGDEELIPRKGQLTLLMPQTEIEYGTNGPDRGPTSEVGVGIHSNPRSDGIALGGTSEPGNWSLEPNDAERRRIVEGHIELFNAMKAPGRRRSAAS